MKRSLILLLLLITTITVYASKERHSQSFMYTHPINQNIAIQQAAWHNLLYAKPGKKCSNQFYMVFQKSVPRAYTARYFLPFPCENNVIAAGDLSPEKALRDVRAEWLNISNPEFSSNFTLNPQQKQLAVIWEYHQDLSELLDMRMFDGYWVSMSIPATMIENDLGLQESDIMHQPVDAPRNATDGLSRRALLYSRMYSGTKDIIGLSEINLKLGMAYLAYNCFEVVYYTGLRIPTGQGQNVDFLFSPFNGNNNHAGLQGGVNFQLHLNQDRDFPCPICFSFFATLESTFLIRNEQYRTYDLKKKPWSRYILLNKKGGPPEQNIPASQIFTLKTRVRPYNIIELSTGWRVRSEHIEAEIGYDIWAHGDERLYLRCKLQKDWAISGTGKMPDGTATSASRSTITNQAANDVNPITGEPLFITLTTSDLDLKSAASRAAFNHKLHASFAYIYTGCHTHGLLNIGGFYEFLQKNSALEQWGIWLKFAVSF
jgi:hypothetical protein